MRGFVALPALLALSLGSTGCFLQASVDPFVGPDDGVSLPALAGEWKETADDEADILEFIPTESPETWTLRYRDKASEPPEVMTIRLGRLDDHLVWDMTLPDEKVPGLVALHRLPLHSLARLSLENDQLEIAFLSPRFFSERADANELDVAHLDLGDDGILLTAKTEAIQAAILEHWSDAFGDTSTFVRCER